MSQWHYETARDLDQTILGRLRQFPREPDMLVFGIRSAAALALRAWLRLYHRLRIDGRENLPAAGSYVMVANHSSHLDALCLLAALPLRKLHRAFPAAAEDYFFVSVPRIAVSAILVNALPFSRRVHVRQSLSLCRALLANPGNVLIVFPEGTRTTTGRVNEFKPGIEALVADTGVPVVPCHISGAFEAWPKGAWWPRPGKLRLSIGRPRTFGSAAHGGGSAEPIAEQLRQAVQGLGTTLELEVKRCRIGGSWSRERQAETGGRAPLDVIGHTTLPSLHEARESGEWRKTRSRVRI